MPVLQREHQRGALSTARQDSVVLHGLSVTEAEENALTEMPDSCA
ncbi:hypothetical protein [Streptomyces syringium]